jgi:hypothetical protein
MYKQNYISIPPPTYCVPPNADQIRVKASLLYPYLGNDCPTLGHWVDLLSGMADDPNNLMKGFQVFYDGNKGVDSTLNFNLTNFLIFNTTHYATGAVASVILAEGLLGASHGHLEHINRTLAEYQFLGKLYPGYVHASTLHFFLRVHAPFEYWLDFQKKNLRLRCGRGYFRIDAGGIYWNEKGPGQIYFDEITAVSVIKATQTYRGQWASFYLNKRLSRAC